MALMPSIGKGSCETGEFGITCCTYASRTAAGALESLASFTMIMEMMLRKLDPKWREQNMCWVLNDFFNGGTDGHETD